MNIIKKIFSWIWNIGLFKKLLILAVVIALALYFLLRGSGGISYITVPLQKGDISDKVEASGTINPVSQTNVGTQVSGIISKMYVDYNTPVKKGQLLAEIDPASLEAAVVQQKANLMKAQSALANDQRTYERYKTLYDQNFVAKSDLDSAETQYLSSKANAIQAQAALDKANTDLKYTKIVSPVDGVVIDRAVDVGQTVAASFQTPTLFTVAQDLTKMQIEVAVSEADIIKVKEGQKVTFTIDGYPNTNFPGVITQVRNSPVTVQNVVSYTVIVSVDNKDGRLRPGMTANVSIVTETKTGVLLAPNAALRYAPSTSTEKFKRQGIWVLEKTGPVRYDVRAGIMDDKNTEVSGTGVVEGMQVITGETTGAAAAKKPAASGPSTTSAMMRMAR